MHARGARKGKPFYLLDVTTGKDLTFATADINKLPESLRGTSLLVFRVTDVNEMDKNKLLYSTHRTAKDRADMEQFVKSYNQEEEAYLNKHKRASYIKSIVFSFVNICHRIEMSCRITLNNLYKLFIWFSCFYSEIVEKFVQTSCH